MVSEYIEKLFSYGLSIKFETDNLNYNGKVCLVSGRSIPLCYFRSLNSLDFMCKILSDKEKAITIDKFILAFPKAKVIFDTLEGNEQINLVILEEYGVEDICLLKDALYHMKEMFSSRHLLKSA